jgi:LmbE family N-acetylglucosaminyl deacetylase
MTMTPLSFGEGSKQPRRLLFLGAHSDDIEIGCGGTALRLAREFPNLDVRWIVFGAQGARAEEARKSASHFLRAARTKLVAVERFRDGFFPHTWAEIKEFFEKLKRDFSPDVIFTHYRNDLHQDHRVINELTWNTFRNHLILEYEVVKYDGDLGTPNFFVHLDATVCRRKIEVLRKCFATQNNRAWFTDDTFYAMLRLRGVESNSPSRYAEAFYCRKMVL